MQFHHNPPPPPSQRPSADTLNSQLQEMQKRLERMNLMLQTLSRLLVAKGIVAETELNEWMAYVDSSDGKTDGRLKEITAPRTCLKCRRISPPTAPACQYCSEPFSTVFHVPLEER